MLSEIPNLRAKIFISSITVSGFIAVLLAAYEAAQVTDYSWLVLGLLTSLSSLFPVYLPRDKGKDRGVVVTISSIFIFTAVLVFGPGVAAMLSTLEATVSTWRTRHSIRSLYKVLFNIFHLPLVTYTVGNIFYLIYGNGSPLNPAESHHLPAVFLTLAACSFLFFLFNSGSIAIAIALVTGQPLKKTWHDSFITASLSNFAEASAAVVVFLNFHETAMLAVGIALPTAFVIYYAYKMNLSRIADAQRHVEEVNELYHSTIEALAMAVDAKDQVTHGHIYRVQAMVLGLARYCGITDQNELSGLRAAALLHDIGKLATPDYILNKPGTLTDSEMETMKAHASVGADILSTVPFPYPVIPFVRYHHEKWDGGGYPDGLKGEEIPLGARVLSIVDCYDALRSDRPYRSKLSREASIDYIQSEAGKSYDPKVVEQLVAHIDELESLANNVHLSNTQVTTAEPAIETFGPKGIANTVFHDIASAHREVQALHEISQAVGRLLNVSETLSLLANKIQHLVPYDGCGIYLVNSTNQQLEAYHASGTASELVNSLQLKLGEGVTGWVAANYRALLNVSPVPDFRDCPELRDIFRSCLAAPLLLDNNVVGVITLYSEESNAFRPNHLRLIENVAHHAATAISNAIVFEETKEDAYTDLLTGLPNLRYFQVFVEQELKRAARSNYPVTLIMMDLDSFKGINDELGHQTGDRVLIEIAHVLRNQLRKSDTCIRYGGDEFIGVLPGVDKQSAVRIIEKIQAAVDDHVIRLEDSESIQVGISIGAASFREDGTRLDQLLIRADQEMYRNKLQRAERRLPARVVPFRRQAETA